MFIYKNKICGIKKYRTTNNPQLEAFPEEDWLHERGASLADSDWPPSGGGYSDQWEHDTSFLAAPTFRGNVNSQWFCSLIRCFDFPESINDE